MDIYPRRVISECSQTIAKAVEGLKKVMTKLEEAQVQLENSSIQTATSFEEFSSWVDSFPIMVSATDRAQWYSWVKGLPFSIQCFNNQVSPSDNLELLNSIANPSVRLLAKRTLLQLGVNISLPDM